MAVFADIESPHGAIKGACGHHRHFAYKRDECFQYTGRTAKRRQGLCGIVIWADYHLAFAVIPHATGFQHGRAAKLCQCLFKV